MYYTLITLGIFAFILVMTRFKVPLWISVFIGTAAAGLFFKLSIVEVSLTMARGAVQLLTVGLLIITLLILSLSEIMSVTGRMEKIVKFAGEILRRPAVVMAALPALIGLLPMPGGALFSAPMVKSAAGDTKIKAANLSAINYWYRHIWEFWWPLYPGVMLAMTLTGMSFAQFARSQAALGVIMVCTGLLLFRGTHPDLHRTSAKPEPKSKWKFLSAISPIWVLLLAWVPLTFILSNVLPKDASGPAVLVVKRYMPLSFGLIVAIVVLCVTSRLKLSALTNIFFHKRTWTMEATVISVMVFQYMLNSAGAADRIASELLDFHVPVVLVVAILPLIAGLVTGLAIGFVGTSFPIVLALVTAMPDHGAIYPYIALAYGFGHLGQMLSPIHICHVVSNEYFKSGFAQSYRRMLPTFVLNFTLIVIYFVVLKTIAGLF